MAGCRGLAPHLLFRESTVSKHVRLARPVDIPNWSAWGDLHSQGCSGLSRTGLLFPVNRTPWSAPRDLHSEGSAILSRRGLLFPLKPGAANWRAFRVQV